MSMLKRSSKIITFFVSFERNEKSLEKTETETAKRTNKSR